MLGKKLVINYKEPVKGWLQETVDFTGSFEFVKAYPKDGVLFVEACKLDPEYISAYSVAYTRCIPLMNIEDFSIEDMKINDIAAHLMMECPKRFESFVREEDIFEDFKCYSHKGYSMNPSFRRVNNTVLSIYDLEGEVYFAALEIFMKDKYVALEKIGLDSAQNRHSIKRIDFRKTLFQEEYIENFKKLSDEEQFEYVVFDISGKDSILIVKKEDIIER